MDIDMHSENDLMDIVQAGDDPSVGDMLQIEHRHPMDIDEVQGGNDGDMHTLDDAMDVDDIGDGQQMEGIELGNANEDLMDIDDANRVNCPLDCGWVFAQHFCNCLGPAYLHLKNILDESNPSHAEVLNDIKRCFREETFTQESIAQVIHAHAEIIRLLYVNFAMVHYPAADEASQLSPTLSYQRLQTTQPLSDSELYDKIRRTVLNKQDLQVLESFLIFNKHILKTNFYQPTKVALLFRLAPDFLPEIEYPNKPFGMFIIIGNEFRGFHIRFRDDALGGIRIVRSRNTENYSINQGMLFDGDYGLAATQSLKNKDIPEGGAKGTILPLAPPRRCFEKYVDAVIDLLIPGQTPGIKEPLVDLYGKPELLFFGPDEGTADMMDWAALHARDHGAETWWKSFTIGKSAELLGGIPHDTYGMTSLSIRQYVLGIYKQLGLREKDITKVQTSGPDGDLGSNEILLSSDKTIAIIDGSGVLADPAGINREELIRLAKCRLTVAHFDKTKLSKDGYLVKVEEQDVRLPSSEIILDGTDFRNGAHFHFKADLFVPCGGRPEAVNISNVAALMDTEGKPHFKYIVEGKQALQPNPFDFDLMDYGSQLQEGILEAHTGVVVEREIFVFFL
ncbi:Aminoacid dehydrogenase-like protein [Suillus hirtellus]|nr:Aminoacid dehydrogenase-like protein [Suillus hirtellus]